MTEEPKDLKYATLVIPEMTHEFGKQWEQPDRAKILIGDKYAIMEMAVLKQLKNYSHSNPSGVYEGKMWRSEYVENGETLHYLHWWGASDKPDHCSHNIRNVLII